MSFTSHYLKPYAARVAAYGFFVVLSVVFTMATALSVADFVKILFPQEGVAAAVPSAGGSLLSQAIQQLYDWLIAFGPQQALVFFALIVFALYACKNIFGYLSLVQMAVLRSKVVRDLRNQLFAKAMRLPLSYYGGSRKGDILSRFGSDIIEYEESTLNSVQLMVTAIVSMVLYLAMLFYISPRLTFFVLCMLPVIVFVISGITHRLRRNSLELQERNAFLTSLMEETIMGLKVIKSFTAIGFSNARFRQADSGYARLRTKVLRRVDLSSPVSDFLGNCVVIGILLFGSSMVLRGNTGLSPELFVSYIMMFVLMIPPSKELTTAISQMKKGRACVDRLQQFLQQPETVVDSPDAQPFNGLGQQIEFRHVGFHYTPGTEVLHDICLTIPKGSTVALVGSSGSGKSTLLDLLMRFYDCTSGQILMDGQPLSSFRIADLRQHIGVVAQDTILFNDTIRGNIAFGLPHATEAQVQQAAQVANAHQFILQQPQGYDTNIGDGGDCLSGGQRQRLSIARAIIRHPDILLFDEATSALDTENERLVQQSLDHLLANSTALVVAHRLSTIQNADLIVVLEQGRIVERGTHHQLLRLQGRYSQLVQMQSFK